MGVIPMLSTMYAVLNSRLACCTLHLVPSRRLEDRIRELCALATAANTSNFADVLAELRLALHEHSEQLRKLARQQLALARGMARTPTYGERVMPVNDDRQQRIVELVAEIETEKEQTRFTALVHELNELLEGKSRTSAQPQTDKGESRQTQAA